MSNSIYNDFNDNNRKKVVEVKRSPYNDNPSQEWTAEDYEGSKDMVYETTGHDASFYEPDSNMLEDVKRKDKSDYNDTDTQEMEYIPYYPEEEQEHGMSR